MHKKFQPTKSSENIRIEVGLGVGPYSLYSWVYRRTQEEKIFKGLSQVSVCVCVSEWESTVTVSTDT